MLPENIFITGVPGSGKTTLVKTVVGSLQERGFNICGFFTEEVRNDAGQRTGFRVADFQGHDDILASLGHPGPRVGKYGVNLPGFERAFTEAFDTSDGCDLIVIDEIGKMELTSPRFRERLPLVLQGDRPVLATLKMGAHPESVGARPEHKVYRLDRANRAVLATDILDHILRLLGQEREDRAANRPQGR